MLLEKPWAGWLRWLERLPSLPEWHRPALTSKLFNICFLSLFIISELGVVNKFLFACPQNPFWTESSLPFLRSFNHVIHISLPPRCQTEVSPRCCIEDRTFAGSRLSAPLCWRNRLRPALKDQCQHPISPGPGWVVSRGPGTVNHWEGIDFFLMQLQLSESVRVGIYLSVCIYLFTNRGIPSISSDLGSALSGSDCGF